MKTMGFRKFILTLFLSTVCALSLSSCFKDEPLNAECDIEQAYIHPGSWLKLWFTNASDTLVNVQSDQDKIEFTMRPFASLKNRHRCSDSPQEPPSSRKAEACTTSPKVLLHTYSYIRRQAMDPHLSGEHQEGTDHHEQGV